MNSREIVIRSIEFSGPERIAMSLPSPFPNDFLSAGIGADPDGKELPRWRTERWERWVDEWGNIWQRLDSRVSGEVVQGAITEWDQLDHYELPQLDDERRFEHAKEVFSRTKDKYRIGFLPGFPFSIARKLRKLELFLEDVVLYPEKVQELCDRIAELLERVIKIYARIGADGVMFCEDWGCQNRLLINPAQWRELFRKYFEWLGGVAKEKELHLIMHSCGYIYDIIPDLVECGVSVLQFDQPEIYGIDTLSNEFGGRVTFWCPVDIQKVLQTGNRRIIRGYAKRMVEKLACFGGGFIAGYYASNEAIGIEPEWQVWACEAFVEFSTLPPTRTL